MLFTNFVRDKIDETHRNVFTVYNNTWFQLWFLFCAEILTKPSLGKQRV